MSVWAATRWEVSVSGLRLVVEKIGRVDYRWRVFRADVLLDEGCETTREAARDMAAECAGRAR